jgi:hypothetical protein
MESDIKGKLEAGDFGLHIAHDNSLVHEVKILRERTTKRVGCVFNLNQWSQDKRPRC